MASKLFAHLRRQWMGALALFVVLGGGVAQAATGGNFILGQANSADGSTRLSSGTSGPAPALKVTNTGTGRAIAGYAGSSQAIYGNSNSQAGVVGQSGSFDGVYGASNGPGAGVSGHNITGGGWGVFGSATGGIGVGGYSDTWQGVYGHSNSNAGVVDESENLDGVYGASHSASGSAISAHNNSGGFGLWAEGGSLANNTAAVHGQSSAGNAVEGFSTAGPGSGVYGQDNNANSYGVAGHSDNGVAVAGDSSNGWAMQSLGNASQSRTAGGFVKAMAYVDMIAHPNDPVQQCFNSQRPPSQATSGNCGITLSNPYEGWWYVNFGFKVDDRIVQTTGTKVNEMIAAKPAGATTIFLEEVNVVAPADDNDPFYIVVY
jgi:hypothetical protein